MEFREYLFQQRNMHPALRPRDVVKLCHQAACGPEHLLADPAAAEVRFRQELDSVAAVPGPLYEEISDGFCRVSLSAWKAAALPGDWLFRMFALSAGAPGDGASRLEEYLASAESVLAEGDFPHAPAEEFRRYLTFWRQEGMPAVSHTPEYRAAETPAYRVVCRRLIRLLPILQRAAACAARPCVIALDGPAASGKTTMAAQLEEILGAAVIHMDDFFLPVPLRTPERYAQPGGNVHHERFCREVLPVLRRPKGFSYTRFDCSVMDFNGTRAVAAAPFRIVEGSYSHHPAFGDYADVTIFSGIDPEEQAARILRRGGPEKAERFRTVWVPLEEAYFSAFGIRDRADLCV